MIGESPALEEALARLSAAARLDKPLLILGERGTGKELAAARVHLLSPRWDGPYVTVNCAALSDDILESELFGHEAGAFTGAGKRHAGRFERADGGTLFLDEIATASLRVQEKILRVVEYGNFERLGGSQEMTVDVRLVTAANVDLRARAKDGRFRADLLDRLAFDVIALPPLRARQEDVVLLASHFGARLYGELVETEGPFPGFEPEVFDVLMAHDWPGNVRELKNVAERAVYRWFAEPDHAGVPVGEAVIDPFDTPWKPGAELEDGRETHAAIEAAPSSEPQTSPPAGDNGTGLQLPLEKDGFDLRAWLHRAEREAVEHALKRCRHNQGEAADFLGLSYHQLRGLLRKHELTKQRT